MTILRLVGGSDVKPAAAGTARIKTCKKSVAIVVDNFIETGAAADETLSETAKNGRLRKTRNEAWREAEAATRYWRVRLDFDGAVEHAQRLEIPEARYHPIVNPEDRYPMVGRYREALVKQLLTPAPDLRSVTWKQAALASRQFRHTSVKSERIERAIAEDLAFLAAHPIRHNNSEAAARRRAFKEVMRRRIRDVAASRDLSDEEIKPALTLKHQEIAHFSEQHGVNIEWLLEGRGRTFKKDPITVNPNMTGCEFAVVVRTLPAAEQRSIEARLREMARKRLDKDDGGAA